MERGNLINGLTLALYSLRCQQCGCTLSSLPTWMHGEIFGCVLSGWLVCLMLRPGSGVCCCGGGHLEAPALLGGWMDCTGTCAFLSGDCCIHDCALRNCHRRGWRRTPILSIRCGCPHRPGSCLCASSAGTDTHIIPGDIWVYEPNLISVYPTGDSCLLMKHRDHQAVYG